MKDASTPQASYEGVAEKVWALSNSVNDVRNRVVLQPPVELAIVVVENHQCSAPPHFTEIGGLPVFWRQVSAVSYLHACQLFADEFHLVVPSLRLELRVKISGSDRAVDLGGRSPNEFATRKDRRRVPQPPSS